MKLKLATTIIATLTFAVVFAQSPVTVITTDGLKISGTIIQRGEDFIRIKLSEGVTRIIYNNTITSIEELDALPASYYETPYEKPEPIKRRFEMSAEFGTSIVYAQFKQPVKYIFRTVNIMPSFIMGYRFNHMLFVGGGVGISSEVNHHQYRTRYAERICQLLDVNIFATLRVYYPNTMATNKISPFAALSLGGHFSNNSGLLINPQIGISIRTSKHKNNSIYLALGFNGQTLKYETYDENLYYENYSSYIGKVNKFEYGFDFRIGYTF